MKKNLIFKTLLCLVAVSISAAFNPSDNFSTVCMSCAVPDGLHAGNISSDSAKLFWNAVAGAGKYELEIQQEPSVPGAFHLETSTTATSYQLSGLVNGATYKFKVRAYCGSDKSDWSEWVSFTASGGGSNNGGNSGSCAIPFGLSAVVNASTFSAVLSWDIVSGAQKYSVEIEDEQNQTGGFHLEDSTTTNNYTVSGLQAGVLYKFKVRSRCASGQSDWSVELFFNSNSVSNNGGSHPSCDQPTGAAATGITTSSAQLSWNAAAGAGAYTLEIERYQHGMSPWKLVKIVQTNSFLLTGLDADTRYKFKVRTNCSGGGHSGWTKWSKFKTLSSAPNNASDDDGNAQSLAEDRSNVSAGADMSVYPVPARNSCTVHLNNLNPADATLRLFDLRGRLVAERRAVADTAEMDVAIDLGAIENGLYILQLQNGATARAMKIVVAK